LNKLLAGAYVGASGSAQNLEGILVTVIATETEYTILVTDPTSGTEEPASRTIMRDIVDFIGRGRLDKRLVGLPPSPGAVGDYFLSNGSRIYVDQDYLEYATPECWSGVEARAAELAGLMIIHDACTNWSAQTGIVARCLYAESRGTNAAAHQENYGIPRNEYFHLFTSSNQPTSVLDGIVIPFIVSRIIWSGLDAMSFKDDEFHRSLWPRMLSPRAAHITHTYHRSGGSAVPLIRIHLPEVDGSLLRICVNSGDFRNDPTDPIPGFTMSLTSLVLSFAGQGILKEDLALVNPVTAIKTINENRWAKVPLQRGDRLDALELQKEVFMRLYKAMDNAKYEKRTGVDKATVDSVMSGWRELLTIHCA
jgi:hypothetical protein